MKKMNFDTPIPSLPFPDHSAKRDFSDEPLVTLESLGCKRITYCPVYFNQGLPHAENRCMMREGAAERLLDAVSMLPENYGFKIFDAWRPFALQQALYDSYKVKVIKENPHKDDAEIDRLVNEFVSLPIKDPYKPPVHTTGGSIDLTIVELSSGDELEMGTVFDHFGPEANADYFEGTDEAEIIANRRLLYNIMHTAGFRNLPSEWWHFDYGNAYWAFFTGGKTKYTGIFSCE